MGATNFRDRYEFDPESYGGEGGGLPGMLLQVMKAQGQRQSAGFGPTPNDGAEYNPDSYGSLQGGLLGRLLALEAEQSQYRPVPGADGPGRLTVQNPDSRQVAQTSNGATLPMPGSPAPQMTPSASPPQAIQPYEAVQAQQAREGVAAHLARALRNLFHSEAAPLDPVDIAKSAGIGLANGVVNTLGLPADALTGFGYLPAHFVENRARRTLGYSDLTAGENGYIDSVTSDHIRHVIENYLTPKFYQPTSRAGRYAETIGEMAPMVVGGEGAAVRFGAKTLDSAVRALPWTLAKHAVAPGIAVQALEEAFPGSGAGQALQKAYPVLRRVIPPALAAKRYLGW